MDDVQKLLPCPFCGADADVSHDHTVEENHAYGCRKCCLWFDTFNADDAIAAWNTRAIIPASDGRADGLREAAELAERCAQIYDAEHGYGKDDPASDLLWGLVTDILARAAPLPVAGSSDGDDR